MYRSAQFLSSVVTFSNLVRCQSDCDHYLLLNERGSSSRRSVLETSIFSSRTSAARLFESHADALRPVIIDNYQIPTAWRRLTLPQKTVLVAPSPNQKKSWPARTGFTVSIVSKKGSMVKAHEEIRY